MFLRKPTHRAYRNLNPIMFLQLARRSGKGLIRPKIHHGALQAF
jgi:hypothetical protein